MGLRRARGWEENVVTDLDELTPLVRAGKVKVVLALNLNELGHSVSPLVQVLRAFVTHDVALIVPSRGIDTSSVPGKVILGMLRPAAAKEGQVSGGPGEECFTREGRRDCILPLAGPEAAVKPDTACVFRFSPWTLA